MMEEFSSLLGMSVKEMVDHPELLINALDHDHRILFWNKRCEMHFGVEAEVALGRKLEDVLPFFKGHEKVLHFDRALMGKEVQVLNGYYELQKGRYEQRVMPVRDASGKVIAALNVVRTILKPLPTF